MTRRINHPLARIASAAPLVLVLLALAPAAQAQDRFARRAHMELSFAPGWGFSLGEPSDSSSGSCGSLYCGFGSAPPPTDAGLSLTTDLRVLAPEGVGFALRIGVEWGVIVLEPGAAYTLDLHAGTEGGVALQLAGGVAIAAAFADVGPDATRDALGGWTQVGVDFRHGSFFAGVALDARAMVRPGDGAAYGVITPTLRIGGEWGL